VDEARYHCALVRLHRILLSVISDAIVHSPGSLVIYAITAFRNLNLLQVVYVSLALDGNRFTAGSAISEAGGSIPFGTRTMSMVLAVLGRARLRKIERGLMPFVVRGRSSVISVNRALEK
jgi:hypothetical protein